MRVLIAVLAELWEFAFGRSVPPVPRTVPTDTLRLQEPQVPLKIAAAPDELPTSKAVAILDTSTAYVCVEMASCHIRPVVTYDGVVARIPYSTPVTLLSYHGRFAHIHVGLISGFIQKDDLTEEETYIHPVCTDGMVYGADDVETQRIRRYIADEFNVAYCSEPLQAIEYVWYMWRRNGTSVSWPATRPRLAGTWHEHLRGVRGVAISVLPKTGAAMEWRTNQGVGVIAYVTAVTPDERITVVVVGDEMPGYYSVREYVKSVWLELRPVFITVA